MLSVYTLRVRSTVSKLQLSTVLATTNSNSILKLLSGLLSSVPIFPPHTRPVYSSISFTLLGYVLEGVTGKTFGEILDTEIIKPLGMENTGLQPKTKISGVIPPVVNVWGADFQDNSP